MRAVFLDRDGTINREVGVLRRLSQLKILPGVPGAIRAMNKLGYLVVIVTNQPVIARGLATEGQVEHINNALLERLAKQGAKINAVYYCPHHPKANVKKYRKNCSCRKPKPGMILKAMKKFGISRTGSFMVGDHVWDIVAGKAVGLKTILVKTSTRSADPKYAHVKPSFIARDLLSAVRIITKHAK